ncbi:unnamed protein product [Paramecium sonneborni]|uniref:Transmembrane protein n=1 Tax=Paramecium sonneborni TaxID=65129 RepID=A0A8S1RCD5_9CILI|nr:unnamed protein product [Paramecium sonneborni]
MIKQYWLEYQQFTIGFSQIILSRDSKYLWILVEVVAHLQRLALTFLFKVIIEILQVRLYNKEIKTDDSYQLFELISKLCVPSILILESVPNSGLIGFQLVIIVIIYTPICVNMIGMHKEYFQYSSIKHRSSIDDQNNLNYNLTLLDRSYNMHNYIEYFMYKQLMGNEQSSFQQLEKFALASLLNIFPHILVIPLMIWNFIIWQVNFRDESIGNSLYGLMIFLNVLTNIGALLSWNISMNIQKTYTIRDNNHLRLVHSFWFRLQQIITVIPILVQWFYLLINLEKDFDQTSTHYYLNISIILMLQVGNLIEFFICHPYMEDYKVKTILIMLPFTLSVIISQYFQHNQIQIISIALITVPLSSRLLNEIKAYMNEEILYNSQFKEKQRQRTRIQSKTALLMEEEEQFVIEKEINKQKQTQLEYLQNKNTKYFIHYLRLVDLMKLDDQQTIEKDASVINLNRSKFILNIIVLLKQHINQCDNVYCYCKGFRGEKRRIIENNYHSLEMRIYYHIKIQNLTIQVELIKRYIRYYAKLIFEIEKEKEDYDIIRITQLLTYLSTSEECYQILLLIMEMKEKIQNKHCITSSVSMQVLLSYTKHQILLKMNPQVKLEEVEVALQYKDYRVTEVRRDKLISNMFLNVQKKYEFIRQLIDNKYNYESLYQLLNDIVDYNLEIIKKIEQFNDFSQSRTSLLIYMFYCIEILNDFDKFIRLRNQLKTKNFKFFESNSGSHNQKVCYLKINLARHAKKGKISRGEIIQYSNNAPYVFGYGQREFQEEILTVNQLVVPHLSGIHDQLMEIFLLTNRPVILRKKRALLAQKKNKDLLFVEMFIDVCFNLTGDLFPIYCFIKQIETDGAYENIKGHLYLNNELKIEGITTMAIEQFKLKDGKSLQKIKLKQLIQNSKKYLELLNNKEKDFQEQELLRQELNSCSQQFNFSETEQLLNHFSITADDILFKIPKENGIPDIFCTTCKFIMTIAKINGKVHKSFMIEFLKITIADNQSQIWIDSPKNLQSKSKTETNMEISQNNEPIESEQQLQSQSIFSQSDERCEFSNISEKQQNQSIHFDEYQFQIGPHIQSPFDSQRDLLSLMSNTNNIQPFDQQIISVQIDGQSLQHLRIEQKIKQKIQNKAKYQQSYFHKNISKKSFEIDNNQSENNQIQKDQECDIRITQTPTTQNNAIPSMLQKTHLYSKFSQSDNHPKLINLIFMIDFLNISLFLSLGFIFYFNFKFKLEENMKIVDILRAFVTTDYTINTLLALGVDIENLDKDHDQLLKSQYQAKLLEQLQVNCQNYLSHYQQYLDDSLVKATLSDIYINQFDYYSGNEQQVSAWTEQFYVIYMQQGLYGINLSNITTIQKYNSSLGSLISQYSVHKEAYEKLTIKFQQQIDNNVSDLENQQEICLIIFLVNEVLLIIVYSIVFRQLFRLLNRILRSCEQISFKALETESIRLLSLQHRYQQPSDLNLYKYQFQFKDKCNINTSFNDMFTNKRISMRFQQIVQQQEQKKQFIISDEKPKFQRLFFLVQSITLLIGLVYFLTVKVFNSSNITSLKNNLDLFNQNIIYTEQFYQMMMTDQILQKYSQSHYNLSIGNDIITQYQTLIQESYNKVIYFGQMIASETEENYFDLLQYLTNDSCSLINDTLCSIVIDGKLTQGLIYSTDYFVQKVSENIQNNYEFENLIKLTELDLIGLNFISEAFNNIMDQGQLNLILKFEAEIQFRTIFFSVFMVIFIIQQFLSSILLYRFFRNRFYKIRQLPYVLPPQSVYGEESFLKTLIYVQKIYDNLLQ